MTRRERDHNIWKSPGGALFFKLGIPPALRHHFKSSKGRDKVKISEPLGTDSLHDARILRDQRLAYWERAFARLRQGLKPEELAAEQQRVRRDALQDLLAGPYRGPPGEHRAGFLRVALPIVLRQQIERPIFAVEIDRQVRAIVDKTYGPGVIAEGSPEWLSIREIVDKGTLDAITAYALGELGEPQPVEQPTTGQPASTPASNGRERFSVALDHYLAWHRDTLKSRPQTIDGEKSKAMRFVKFASDPTLDAVTIDVAKKFLESLEVGDETRNQHKRTCFAVFRHAREERRVFFGDNPFKFRRRKTVVQSKDKYTVDELNKIFGSPTFTERQIKPTKYNIASAVPWAAAIALFSGAALEEVAQLRPKDIRQEAGNVWVISIDPKAALNGALKRKNRERLIPLHPELERLGLLRYRDALPRGAERLFPGLPVEKSKNKFGPELGRAFNDWRRELGIVPEDRKLDFHSFRHTFGKAIEDVGIPQTDRHRLLGHKVPGISSSVYSAPELSRVAPLVARVAWSGLNI
jgi:integrase